MERKRLYTRQAVTLTGLSTETFAKAVENCNIIFSDMRAKFLEETTAPWQCGTYEGHATIDAHTRYFSLRKEAPTEQNQPFWQGVDPDGVLSKLRKQDLIHGADNIVKYKKLTVEADGQIQ